MTDAVLKLRCDSSLLAAIDASAAMNGITRSAWVRDQLARSADNDAGRTGETLTPGALLSAVRDRQRVEVRLSKALLKRLDQEAAETELSRGDFIRRTLHAHFYSGDRFRVLSLKSDRRFATLNGRLAALQRMVNTIERAVKAIVRDGKFHELGDRLDDLLVLSENLLGAVQAVTRFATWVTFEEHRYWRRDAAACDLARMVNPLERHPAEAEDDEDVFGDLSAGDAGAGE